VTLWPAFRCFRPSFAFGKLAPEIGGDLPLISVRLVERDSHPFSVRRYPSFS
jgi:hypothetical protein